MPCDMRLSILVLLDNKDYRAIIMPGEGPHNHPIYVQAKIPYSERRSYAQCVVASGVVGITPLQVDRGDVHFDS